MTWRKDPYPHTEDEIKCVIKWLEKHRQSVDMMKALDISFEGITRYPGGLPDGMVSIHDLYDIFSDEEKFKDLIFLLKNKAFW